MSKGKSTRKGKSLLTKQERAARRQRCMQYLRHYGSLPEARRAAKAAGLTENTSVWIGALADMLGGKLDAK